MRSKIGFTSKTFAPFLARGLCSLDDLVRWAAEIGFDWMELRDSRADSEPKELERLKRVAAQSGLLLHYAWDGTNVLDRGDRELFTRGLAKAGIFGEGVYSRITIAGKVIKDSKLKVGYSRGEYDEICRILAVYIREAAAAGVSLVFENSHEPIVGDGATYWGIQELLDGVPSMRLAFDPANALNEAGVHMRLGWSDMLAFYRKNGGRIPYSHIKSIRGGKILHELMITETAERECLRCIMREVAYGCLELPEFENFDLCRETLIGARRALSDLS
jgi:sugar phosphate isomerase/epimerase